MTILERNLSNTRIQAVEGDMMVSSLYTAGLGNEIFLRGIKDQGKLIGTVSKNGKIKYLQARHFCERTLERLTATAVAPDKGELFSFTQVMIDLDGKPLEKPQWVGFFTFKGFQGGVVHYLENNGKKLKIGAKVKPVYLAQKERQGSILDIKYFELV